jgi:hypothetical protein
MRFRNVEFRWCKFNEKYELVNWYKDCNHKEFCCVVAFFDKDKEGYNMRTISSRFFEDKDAWVVAKSAMSFLQDTFEIEKQEEELK